MASTFPRAVVHGTRALALLVLLGLSAPILSVPAVAAKPVLASIIIDANTGEVLHAVNPDARTYPASTTKIMTLYLLFEAMERGRLKMDSMLRVSDLAASQAPSKLGLESGGRISVRDAMLAVVTKSANDMAVVLAEAMAGSEEAFAERMTKKARELGMKNTRFKNASGLPDPDQTTTARDLAVLGMAVLRDYPRQYQVFSTRDFSYDGHNHANHNKLLGRYDGMDGIKTGYIRASGFNLVASATRNGRRLVGVVLGGTAPGWRDKHMAQLLDVAFKKRSGTMVATVDQNRPEMSPQIADTIKKRPGAGAPEPVIATADPSPPEPAYTEDDDEKTIADLVSDDAAEEMLVSGNWGVQIGAFRQVANAQKAAEDARRYLPANLSSAKPVVDEATIKRSKIYQARLVGMSEVEARNLCRSLKKKKVDCLAVPPNVPGVSLPQSL